MFPIRLFALASGLTLIACGAAAHAGTAKQSSPIALSANDQMLLNVNPDTNTVTIFNVSTNTPRKLREVPVGHEPASVAIHPNGLRAFVANTGDGAVGVIDLGSRRQTSVVKVDAEPMALCLSPNGTRLYVANSASNSLTVLNTSVNPPTTVATIDLSAFGTSPRAVAVTNDGDADDTDETIFVAMFFGQLRPGKSFIEEGQDDQREGHVVAISAATNTVLGAPNPVVLGPMAVTGFKSNGQLAPGGPPTGSPSNPTPFVASINPESFNTDTGAFPNQLAAIALHPTLPQAYVVSTGASPNGPLRFNSMAQGLVSVFDAGTRTEVTSGETGAVVHQKAPLNLNQGVNRDNATNPRLFLTNPVAMAWRPDGSDAWVVIQNSDLVVRLTVDGSGIPTINAPQVFAGTSIVRVDLQNVPTGLLAGKAPRGIAINSTGTRAFVSNFVSRSITAIDISNATAPVIVGAGQSTALPRPNTVEAMTQLGAELFYTGRGPQGRMSSESWGGCIVCHPNGRADGITWMFDAGPRQTIPLDAVFDPKQSPTNTRRLNWTRGPARGVGSLVLGKHPQRILNWSAVRDENQDFELNTRGVFGGRGLIEDDRLFYAIGGNNGSDLSSIDEFDQVNGGPVTPTGGFGGGADLPHLTSSRRDFAIATLDDARVYILGGRSGSGDGKLVGKGDSVLEFNPRTNTLTKRSSVGFTPRHSLGAAAVRTNQGFRIYAIGGYSSTDPASNPVGTVEEYNPATNTWRSVSALPGGNLPTAVAQFGITVAGGINTADPRQLIHVVGGNAGSESAPSLVGSTLGVQRFSADPTGAGAWSNFTVTGLTTRRNHGAATAFRGAASRIFVIGGQNAAGTVLDTVEEYTNATVPAAVTSTHTPINISTVSAPRRNFGIASSLSTNQIYVVGGLDNADSDQISVLEYTVNTNGSTPGPAGTPSGLWKVRGTLANGAHGLQVSSPPGVTNFLPNKNTGRDSRQDSIAAWIATNVRTSRAPVAATDSAAIAGRTLFGTTGLVISGFSCATCHGGPKWTRSAVDYNAPPSPDNTLGLGNERVIGAELRHTSTQPNTPGPVSPPQFPGVLLNVGTFTPNSALPGGRVNEIRFNGADISQSINPLGANGFNIPSLLSVHETAPYFYSGLAQTLEEVLNGSQDPVTNGGTRHHFVTNVADRANLIAFLRSIDATTPIFP